METQSARFRVEPLSFESMYWFVETAAINMINDELKRPELINLNNFYGLAARMLEDGTAFVVFCEDKPVGAIGSVLVPNIFNPTLKTLAEMFWYVLPDYRQTRAGILLLKALETRGMEVADEITLSVLPSTDLNSKSLSKRGFNVVEFGLRKELNNGSS